MPRAVHISPPDTGAQSGLRGCPQQTGEKIQQRINRQHKSESRRGLTAEKAADEYSIHNRIDHDSQRSQIIQADAAMKHMMKDGSFSTAAAHAKPFLPEAKVFAIPG